MDFYDDLTNLKKFWKERSTIGRVFLVAAFLMSILSVSSLADTVFGFKGFLIDGIEFYRAATEPIIELLKAIFNWEIDRLVLDTLIVGLLVLGASVRSGIRIAPPKRRSHHIVPLLLAIIVFWGLCGALLYLLHVFSTFNPFLITLLVTYPLIPVLVGIAVDRNSRPPRIFYLHLSTSL